LIFHEANFPEMYVLRTDPASISHQTQQSKKKLVPPYGSRRRTFAIHTSCSGTNAILGSLVISLLKAAKFPAPQCRDFPLSVVITTIYAKKSEQMSRKVALSPNIEEEGPG